MDLADFLLARIAEDEAAAVEAGGDVWEAADPRKVRWVRGHAHGWAAFADLPAAAEHIARWDPARVMAECEAKRRIVAEHGDINADWVPLFGDAPEDRPISRCQTCTSEADPGYLSPFPCLTLRLLALPYADHPDYDEAWRP